MITYLVYKYMFDEKDLSLLPLFVYAFGLSLVIDIIIIGTIIYYCCEFVL